MPSFLLLFFQVRSIGAKGQQEQTAIRLWSMVGRMQNPAPGKRFYCQGQVGENAKVIKLGWAAGDFFGDKAWVIGGGERGVYTGAMPWIHEPVLSFFGRVGK